MVVCCQWCFIILEAFTSLCIKCLVCYSNNTHGNPLNHPSKIWQQLWFFCSSLDSHQTFLMRAWWFMLICYSVIQIELMSVSQDENGLHLALINVNSHIDLTNHWLDDRKHIHTWTEWLLMLTLVLRVTKPDESILLIHWFCQNWINLAFLSVFFFSLLWCLLSALPDLIYVLS